MFFYQENINTKDSPMLAESITICPPQIYTEPRLIFCRHPSLDDKVSAIASKTWIYRILANLVHNNLVNMRIFQLLSLFDF